MMKKSVIIYIALIGMISLLSCKKEEVGPVLSDPVGPELTLPAAGTSIVLSEATASELLALEWTAADYGFQAAVTYSVQFDLPGNDFAEAGELVNTGDLTGTVSYADLNNMLIAKGLPDGVASDIEIRVVSKVSDYVTDLVSAVISLSIKPYLVVVSYPYLGVPGSHQGWDPANESTVIYSLKSDGIYEGYLYFADAGTEFKFTDGPGWDVNWGDTGDDGTLDPGGDNIIAADPGYYKLNVDINALTYTKLKTDWGLIGSATPGGWDSDQDMSYDAGNSVFTITLDLIAGEIKFRANDAWDINLGDNDANSSLEYDGANIVVGENGNYTITLNLQGPIYNYTITLN